MTLKTTKFDVVDYLKNDENIAMYLSEAFETGDEAFIIDAIGIIARAKGMSDIAAKANLSRPSLYRGLKKSGKPQFGTILAVLSALDIKLSASAM
ncbi:MAG: putative addiction module antidote protein [Robiginitomaculum sp.]|nr:MAG: putative addiction module antidote protein [Robiginitomaculum sp.]